MKFNQLPKGKINLRMETSLCPQCNKWDLSSTDGICLLCASQDLCKECHMRWGPTNEDGICKACVENKKTCPQCSRVNKTDFCNFCNQICLICEQNLPLNENETCEECNSSFSFF